MTSDHDVFFSFLLGHSLASQQTLLSVIVHGKQFKCLSLTENDGAIKSLVLFNIISLLHSSEFLSNLNGVCSVIKISYLRTVKVRPVCLIVLFILKYVFRCPLPQTNSTFFIQSITSVIRNTSSNHTSSCQGKEEGVVSYRNMQKYYCIFLKMQTLETLTPVETVRSRFILLHICRTFAPQ